MTTDFTLSSNDLSHMLDAVEPHTDGDGYHPILDGILLDSDGAHLHVVATDRYTIAVARTEQPSPSEPWKRLLTSHRANALRAWLPVDDEQKPVNITATGVGITCNGPSGTLSLPAGAGTGFPDWRKLLRDHAAPGVDAPLTVLSTDFLQRWTTADRYIQVWQADPAKPFVVAAEDFLGMQMPMTKASYPDTPIETLSAWAKSLGSDTEGDEPTPAEDVLNGNTSPGRTDGLAESLLKQVLHSSADLHEAVVGDPRAAVAHAQAGTWAWTAYRLLDALRKADPLLAATTVKNLDEELEGGEFSENAWDEATAAGHDPQKWTDEYEAARKAAKDKATAAGSTS